MTGPRFSVVIPTRDRADTLAYTLRTCLAQDFDDYEIVVSNQGSDPAVGDVIARCASPRIRYIHAPDERSSRDNWNRAISEARGEFVMFLGSDDGLLPYALRELDQLARTTGAKALTWRMPIYIWPGAACPEEANYLTVPLERYVNRVESRAHIAAVLRGETCFSSGFMPNIYHGLIHRDLIDELRRRTGTVFSSFHIDSYSAFCFAWLAGNYVVIGVPMTINAFSATSLGAVMLTHKTKTSVYQDRMQAIARDGIHLHPWVPDLPLMPVMSANEFLSAKAALFPDDDELVLDRKRLASQCVAQLWTDDVDERRELIGIIRASLADVPELVTWFDSTDPMSVPSVPPFRYRSWGLGFKGESLCLNADEFGVFDVAAAAELIARLLGYPSARINYDLPSRAQQLAQMAQQLAALQQETERQASIISQLNAERAPTPALWRRLARRVLRGSRRLANLGRGRKAG